MATLRQTIVNIGRTIENESIRLSILEERIHSLPMKQVSFYGEEPLTEKFESLTLQKESLKKSYCVLGRVLATRDVPVRPCMTLNQPNGSEQRPSKSFKDNSEMSIKPMPVEDQLNLKKFLEPGDSFTTKSQVFNQLRSVATQTTSLIEGKNDLISNIRLASGNTGGLNTQSDQNLGFISTSLEKSARGLHPEIESFDQKQSLISMEGIIPMASSNRLVLLQSDTRPLEPVGGPRHETSQSAPLSFDLNSFKTCSPVLTSKNFSMNLPNGKSNFISLDGSDINNPPLSLKTSTSFNTVAKLENVSSFGPEAS